jgi:hypothetical protein
MRGVTVYLHVKTESGTDAFGAPIYVDEVIPVDNVLIGEPSSDQAIQELNLYGKRLAYVLAIPKGDDNVWTDTEVEFFGEKFRTYGEPTQGIEGLIPLSWNKKVRVERYG